MNIPVVSILMITYGQESYVRQDLEGVLMQKCNFDVEIILANDCSPDNTDKIIQDVLKTHPHASWVKYIKHEKNIGMISNFIHALQKCMGKYIAMCEGDDYWIDPLKLQKQFNILENNPEYKFCVTNLNFYNQRSAKFEYSILNTTKKPLYHDIEDFLVKKGFMAPCTWFGSKECFFLTSVDEIQTDGTFAIFIDVLQYTKVYFLDETTSVYRILQESASHSSSVLKKYIFIKGLYKTQLHYIEKYDLKNLKKSVHQDYIDCVINIFNGFYQNKELLEIVELIKSDFNSDDVALIMQGVINCYQNKLIQINNSKSMLIGKIITRPFVEIIKKINK